MIKNYITTQSWFQKLFHLYETTYIDYFDSDGILNSYYRLLSNNVSCRLKYNYEIPTYKDMCLSVVVTNLDNTSRLQNDALPELDKAMQFKFGKDYESAKEIFSKAVYSE